ncbi:MAG: AraC family transcriptional regulator [Bacteroidota bacterium]|nr:AraC family transcriptional regulator [Bacteroidota bacterium]
MKPKLLKISFQPEQSFSVRIDSVPYFFCEWHFHPELELVHIHKGTGTQFIGDAIEHFKPGDMILVGSNLPHLWKCDDKYFEKGSKLKAESTVIHFMPDVFGEHFFSLPENKSLIKLFDKARQGIRVTKKTRQLVGEKMQLLLQAEGTERIILLLQILQSIANSKEVHTIASKNIYSYSKKESERLNPIFQYLFTHFSGPVKLNEVAALAHMSPHSFCRYFKLRTRKTFSRFLMEVRIGHACKLLSETDKSVSQVCYESGFNNFSNFNRHFKEITGKTPLQHRKLHL